MPFLKPAPRSANIRIERVVKAKVNVLKPVSSGVKRARYVTKSSPSAADKEKSSPETSAKVTKKTSDEIKATSTEPKTPKPKTKTKGTKTTDKASADPARIPSSTKTGNRVSKPKRTKKSKELPKGLVAIGSFGSAAATHRAQLGAGQSNVRLLPTALPFPLPVKKAGEAEGSAKGSAEPKKMEKKKVTIAAVGLTTPSPTPSRGSSQSRKQ
ncbi:hypothetical protein CFIO01_01338 [Colletotrichum fioriniae PJ7]|uniref:Uncharacterized protein n=1 Tax=Colletotrichum fioriniae PJ7 TaxID=1445577 RepID=A0A010SDZ7_9PEZI|nr:hypothetical protein CFIO01_01338 [Colletotrichum fioriniae PJ7]